MTKVDLGGTKVADDDLKLVASLPGLRVLGLRSTAVGDAGLAHLRGLERLEVVEVDSTRVTETGRRRFQERQPKVRFGAPPSGRIPRADPGK